MQTLKQIHVLTEFLFNKKHLEENNFEKKGFTGENPLYTELD